RTVDTAGGAWRDLLRVHGERPRCCRAADEGVELAALHVAPLSPRITRYHIGVGNTALCITANSGGRCRSWVRLGHSAKSAQCPVCPKADIGRLSPRCNSGDCRHAWNESLESVVIERWWPDSGEGHRCGRRRIANVTTAAGCDIRVI